MKLNSELSLKVLLFIEDHEPVSRDIDIIIEGFEPKLSKSTIDLLFRKGFLSGSTNYDSWGFEAHQIVLQLIAHELLNNLQTKINRLSNNLELDINLGFISLKIKDLKRIFMGRT